MEFINKLIKNCVHLEYKKNCKNLKNKKFKYNFSVTNLNKVEKKLEIIKNIFKILIRLKRICLFVCTEKKYKKLIQLFCNYINMPFITKRWLGGLLTNFNSIKKSINNYKYNLNIIKNKKNLRIKKKSIIRIKKRLKFKRNYLTGIKNMNKLPDVIFIINTSKNKLAIKEANKIKIPVIALVDGYTDYYDNINYKLNWNSESIKSIIFLLKELTKVFI